ncbi:MAG: amidohydrolase family protein [Chloroflexota bacterium]
MPFTLLTNCQVIDATGAEPIEGAAVAFEDGRVTAVGRAGSILPRTAQAERTIDLEGAFLLPGLINLHVHLGLALPGRAGAELGLETPSAIALRMMMNAGRTLAAGTTTIRCVGERFGADFAVREAIRRGWYPGPRIYTAGSILCMTGGHGHLLGGYEADGPAEFAKAARLQLKGGADHIKITITGGNATPGVRLEAQHMTETEMASVVEVTHHALRKVTAHSGGKQAILAALRAGVDCFEHGYMIDRECAATMATQGAYLVPTIGVTRCPDFNVRNGLPGWMLEKNQAVAPAHWEALRNAVQARVRIGMGTDMFPFEEFEGTVASVREIELMHEAGLPPMAAIQSATKVAADLLDASDDLGTITPGTYADLIAVPRNPLDDLRHLRDIRFVMLGGQTVPFAGAVVS